MGIRFQQNMKEEKEEKKFAQYSHQLFLEHLKFQAIVAAATTIK